MNGVGEGSGYERIIDGVIIERRARGLRITRPWSKIAGLATLVWIGVWSELVTFVTLLDRQSTWARHVLLAIPGIPMAYVAMTRCLNRTIIEIDASELVLRHVPLPWPGGRRIAIRDVAALHIETRKIHTRGHTVDEHWIRVVRPNGKKAALLKGLEMTELQMSSIAAAISEYLGIPITAGRD